MKVLIDITEEMYKRINEVNRGSSLSSFIQIAIENQISLELDQQSNLIEFRKESPPHLEKDRVSPNENYQRSDINDKIEILNNPLNFEKLIGVSLKQPIKNYYIWGQYNKFFAMKFAVRYLVFMQLQNKSESVNLTEFQTKCSRSASKMKQILKQSDEKAGRLWGEGFSAGLPDEEEKSQSRFMHHFIGYTDTQGNPVGALPDLGFVVIKNNGGIALSSEGLAFAKIRNPILDEDAFSSNLFSQDEREFLIEHLKRNIPLEWKGIQTVIKWIETGINTPDSLTAKFATLDKKWTDKMANTYRTGMLARMYDLRFISRKKIGIKSNYVVTDVGKKYEADHL